ncbi:MAG: hypothetical protein K6F32_01420 [Bacilli bacterium]|nr:hypothetical protein [Bacilli bacterium]
MSKINEMLDPHTGNKVAPPKQVSTKMPPVYGTIAGLSYKIRRIVGPRYLTEAVIKEVAPGKNDEGTKIAVRALHLHFYDEQKPEDNIVTIKPLSKEEAKRAFLRYVGVEIIRALRAFEKKNKVEVVVDEDAFLAACIAKKPSKTDQVELLPGLGREFRQCGPIVDAVFEKVNPYR